MRIDASNLIAAQAARPPQRPQPPAQKAPQTAKPTFDSIDFPKGPKDVSAETPAHPHEGDKHSGNKQAGHKQPGSHVDITV